MARRTALTMAKAAGDDELAVNQVLHRFGFDAADTVGSAAEALQRVRQQKYDLLILALDQMDSGQLIALERELRREPSMNVIATGPKSDPNMILTALRSGVHEFLVRPPSAADLNAALERITRRVPGNGMRGSVVAVYSAKGGVGVSTVAVNLAFQLAAMDPEAHIALADLVVGLGDVRMMLNLKTTYDINDLVARAERVDADVLYTMLTERNRVWVLPSSDKADGVDLDSSAATAIIAQLRSHFSTTVLDCEDHLSDHIIAALDAADRIVLVSQLTIPVLRSTERTLQLFTRLGYRDEKTMVVINRYHSADTVSLSEASTVLRRPIVATLSNDYAACSKAITKGVPLSVAAPHSGLATDLSHLARRIAESLVPPKPGVKAAAQREAAPAKAAAAAR